MSESRFVTVSRSSPEFKTYISGTFSKLERALPIKSLNVGSLNEEVTFQIKKISEIERPHLFWLQPLLTKVSHFWFLAFPLLFISIQIAIDETSNPAAENLIVLFAALGFAYFGLQLRSEASDHEHGWDRAHPWAGSRSLQNGWATASQLKKIAAFCLSLSFFAGVFLLSKVSLGLQIYSVVSALFLGITLLVSENFKLKGLGEILGFLFLGPILVIGLTWFFWGDPLKDIFLGVILGLWVWLAFFVRNLQVQFFSSRIKLRNTVTLLGFENSKKLFPYFLFSGIVTSFMWDYFHANEILQPLSFSYLIIVGAFGVHVSQKILLSQGPFFSSGRKEFSLLNQFFTLHYSVWLLIWLLRWLLS